MLMIAHETNLADLTTGIHNKFDKNDWTSPLYKYLNHSSP